MDKGRALTRQRGRGRAGRLCPNIAPGNYITKLPNSEHAPEWQAAMEALLLVAEHGGPTMLARIGVIRALNRRVESVFKPARKDHHWGRRRS